LSIPERILNISKAYLNQVRDRIDSELSDAERELDVTPGSRSIDEVSMHSDDLSTGTDPEAMMRRAEARIAAARRDLESRNELAAKEAQISAPSAPSTTTPSNSVSTPSGRPTAASNGNAATSGEVDPNFHDYRVLGVPVGGDLAQVQAEYEQLTRRCDPRRFPDGSADQKQAEAILQRVNVAFEALRKRLDPTVNRFGKLELE